MRFWKLITHLLLTVLLALGLLALLAITDTLIIGIG
jgi:hypothetical protein